MRRQRFDPGPAPSNYVPGLGRGASGFTTRSDIGPARSNIDLGVQKPEENTNTEYNYSDGNFDESEGYKGENLFASDPYEEDDKEADLIWESIDKRMDSRRKKARDIKLLQELSDYRQKRPKIQYEFADLKKKLSDVSESEWFKIPEIGDRSIKKNKRPEIYTPVPDNIILQTFSETKPTTTTSSGSNTSLTDLKQIGEAQKLHLKMSLNQASESVRGQTVVDSTGYLTDLNTLKVQSENEVTDIKKARLLLQNARKTNPNHPPGWIAAARLEETAGKLATARKIIMKGCETCPKSEDIWLEAARLHSNNKETAKIIFAKAVKQIPTSVKIWQNAANLEEDPIMKKKILRRGLEYVPNSVPLWKSAIELEDPKDAILMLSRAVECIPHSVEMWLALAHLESYENARIILNKARKAVPTEPSIWINASKLEEANNNSARCFDIIKLAISSLTSEGVSIDREKWLSEAELAEKSGSPATCKAIVQNTIQFGVENEDRKRTWLEDAENAIKNQCLITARAVYEYALDVFPKKESLWIRASVLEKQIGDVEQTTEVLRKAVSNCPHSETLWLMAAKEKWLQNCLDEAKDILKAAFQVNPGSEKIWLAAVKLQRETGKYEDARGLLSNAREKASTQKVWLKSVKFERLTKRFDLLKPLAETAIKMYPTCDKFYLLLAEMHQILNQQDLAIQVYKEALKQCPNSIQTWVSFAQLELKNSISRARSILENARLSNAQNPLLWFHSVRVELSNPQNSNVANSVLAKALQDCPNSGLLRALAIEMAPKNQKKTVGHDALKVCNDDPYVVLAISKMFWEQRIKKKAQVWLERATSSMDGKFGDAWAHRYKFTLLFGEEKDLKEIIESCDKSKPKHGELWAPIYKDINNVNLKPSEVMKLVAEKIDVK